MPTYALKYQTAENLPPPFAHAIEISGEIEQNQDLVISFELTYLDRDQLSEEEIIDEGFSLDDDFKWQGTLPKVWKDIVFGNLKSSKPLKIQALESHQDFWQIDFEGKSFYPANAEKLTYLIEEIQQAVFEKAQKELPFNLIILKTQADETKEVSIKASFVERRLEIGRKNHENNTTQNSILPWEELNFILKNVFSGEFIADLAFSVRPSHRGLFINTGDDLWYEVGRSLIIEAYKIQKILKM